MSAKIRVVDLQPDAIHDLRRLIGHPATDDQALPERLATLRAAALTDATSSDLEFIVSLDGRFAVNEGEAIFPRR